MNIMFAALNPNLTDEDLISLFEQDMKHKEKLLKTFEECYKKLPDAKQKAQYLDAALPCLMMYMCF